MHQQFNQPTQAQFFDGNSAQHQTQHPPQTQTQDNFPHDQQQMLQQLTGLMPRTDDNRQHQMLQQHLQQFASNQAQMFDNKNYQSMLAQQNNRPASVSSNVQGQNQAISAPTMQQNHLQSLNQNSKNFYGQQQSTEQRPQTNHLDMNQIQQQSLMQLQQQLKNIGAPQNVSQANGLLNNYFQQPIQTPQAQKPVPQDQGNTQDQMKAFDARTSQMQALGSAAQQQLIQQPQNLLLHQRANIVPQVQVQNTAQNSIAQTNLGQQRALDSQFQSQQNQQQLQQYFKLQQDWLNQNKDANQGSISQLLMQQQNFPQQYQPVQQTPQNAIGQQTNDSSPHLAHSSIHQFNKQTLQQLNQTNQNLALSQLQNSQQALLQRPLQNMAIIQPNNAQNSQLQQHQAINQGLQKTFSQQNVFGQMLSQQLGQFDNLPKTLSVQSEKVDQQRQINQLSIQATPNLSQNPHQQNLMNLMGNLSQMGQNSQAKDQLQFQQSNIMQLQQPGILGGQHLTNQQLLQQHYLNTVQGQNQLQVNNQIGAQIKNNQFLMNQNQQAQIYQNPLQTNNPGTQFQMQQVPKSEPEQELQTQNQQLMSQYATLQQANENTQQRTQHDINNLGLQQIPKTDSTTLLTFQNLGKLAEFCATRGDYQLAIEYYKHMTNLQPDNGPSWMALGHCCLLTDEIHQAFNAYQHALNCVEDIKDPQLWYGIGILYEKFESYDNAISALVGVLKMSPNFYQKSEVLYKLGIIFAKTNQINQAINYFQNSILTNSFTNKRKVDTLLKIGLLYEEKRDFNQAQRSYEAALSYNDKNHKIFQHLAWCSFQNSNIPIALDHLQKAEKREKDNADTFYIKGRCYLAINSISEAHENFSKAIEKTPSDATYLISFAAVLYLQNQYHEAFTTILKAQNIKPDSCEVWYNLGILYEKCKQASEAIVAYNRILEIDPNHKEAKLKVAQFNRQDQRGSNQQNLQMLHPVFNVPNTLQILRKFKQEHSNPESPNSPQISDNSNLHKINQNMLSNVQQQIQSSNVNYQTQQLPMQPQQPNQTQLSPRPEFFDQQRANQSNIQILQQRSQVQHPQGGQLNANQMQMAVTQQMQQQQFDQQKTRSPQQSLQILQQTQRIAQPQSYAQQNFQQRGQMYGQADQLQDRGQVLNQQIRISASQQLIQESASAITEWDKLRQQAQQDQIFRSQNAGFQQAFNLPEVMVKQEEGKKSDPLDRLADNADSENNTKFNFALNTQADQQNAEKNEDFAGQQQSTYTQFIRINPMSNQNQAQQFQKGFQDLQKPQTSNFQILQQHQIVKVGSQYQPQMRNPVQENETDDKGLIKQLQFDAEKNKPQGQDNKQEMIQEMIMKQKLYQQMESQPNQMQSANDAHLDSNKEDFIGNQIQQLINAQKNQTLMPSQILAQNQRKPMQQEKHMFRHDELVKKLYEVKEAKENDPEYVVAENGNVQNFTGQLHQKFDLKPIGDHAEALNGPSEQDNKAYDANKDAQKQSEQAVRNAILNARHDKLKDMQAPESDNPRNE